MAVLIKLRFSLPALIFNSASKRQIQWNSYQYIWRGVYIRGAYNRMSIFVHRQMGLSLGEGGLQIEGL